MGILLTDAATAGSATANFFGVVVFYALFLLALYLLLMRPQKKQQKEHAALISSLEIGDCIMTTSGFYGIIIDIDNDENTIIVEFGSNKNCRIPMDKSAISKVEKSGENA